MYKCETERNVEIVKLKMRGWKDRQIADRYHIVRHRVVQILKNTLPKVIADEQVCERLKYLTPMGAIHEYKDLINERLDQLQAERFKNSRLS